MQTKEQKKAAAEERQKAYSELTPAQKLAKLDRMFGPGKGAARERARIAEQQKPKQSPKAEVKAETTNPAPVKKERKITGRQNKQKKA